MKFRLDTADSSGTIYQQIVRNRNFNDDFIASDMSTLPDMYKMKDLGKAADRIIKAIREKEKIIIFGHDDLDGITATYLLFDFLESAGSQAHYYYIPNRLLENHGMQRNFINKVKDGNFDLVVTVDGGISCNDAVDEIVAFGCDVVITDHHLIPEILPNAHAIVNAKQTDCQFEYDMLAGVGVSWYLCRMMADKLGIDLKKEYLFWTAVGTIADKVPLDGLNRVIVKEILDNWSEYNNDVINALSGYLWTGTNVSSSMSIIRYLIKLFANGRDSDGKNKSVHFLLNPLQEKSETLKALFDEMRQWGKKLRHLRFLMKDIGPSKEDFGYLYFDKDDNLPLECLGISATIVSKENKIPALFLKRKNDAIVCEARCTEGLSLIDLFNSAKDNLIQFGGHVKAAGFTIEEEKLTIFTNHFYDYCKTHQDAISSEWKHIIDAIFDSEDISKYDDFIKKDYDKLQPFGQGNPEPIYLMRKYNPERDKNRLKMKQVLFDSNSEYDVVFKIYGSGIKVLDFAKLN